MIKKYGILIIYFSTLILSAYAVDINDLINPVNPLESNTVTEIDEVSHKATLTQNATYNLYAIALNRYIQSNVKAAYNDSKILIENALPMDYMYLDLAEKMSELGFFDLAELAISKLSDRDISFLLIDDVRKYYYPAITISQNDELYLAEMYSNIVYNDQAREVANELIKTPKLLEKYDYANYIAALGFLKSNNIIDAEKYIDIAIAKNPKNINYKKLKAEILSQTQKPKKALKIVSEIKSQPMLTYQFTQKINSLEEYILYKSKKNEFEKKYHLAYYFYLENDLNKSMRTLQTAFNTQKDNNKKIYALLARVYYDLKEYEKAEDNAQKACKLDKSNAIALEVLGDLSFRKKDYDAAVKYYSQISSVDEKLAQCYEKQHKTKKAYDMYVKILKTHSDSYQAYYQMALLDKEREMTYLKKSIAVNYQFKDGWLDLARLAIENENIPLAASYLSIVKYIDENDFRYYYYLGLIYKNKGLTADAKRNFHKSLKLNPNYAPAKEELSI